MLLEAILFKKAEKILEKVSRGVPYNKRSFIYIKNAWKTFCQTLPKQTNKINKFLHVLVLKKL